MYSNIEQDIRDYDAGKLDVTVKSLLERLQEERELLQTLYIEKSQKLRDLEEYVVELEQMLTEQGLESARMAKQRISRHNHCF